jgi:hypothetical protein
MEYCRLKGVLLQAWSPLAQGILTGKRDRQPENLKEAALLVQKYAECHETNCRGHPAGLTSQAPSEDPARVGNFPSRSLAGLCKGGFSFFKPRRMVPSLCRSPGRTYALKFERAHITFQSAASVRRAGDHLLVSVAAASE